MNNTITRSAYLRSTTAEMIENRQAEFVISSEAVDSYGTVFKMDGWDLNRYLQNPIVCYQHRSFSDDPDNVIGLSEVFIEGDELIGRVRFEDEDINAKAEKIRKKVNNGTLKMASVGARVKKATFGDEEKGEDPNILYFRKAELIEWSVVTVGANPDAHKRNETAIHEIRKEALKEINVEDPQQIQPTKNTNKSVREARLINNKNKQ